MISPFRSRRFRFVSCRLSLISNKYSLLNIINSKYYPYNVDAGDEEGGPGHGRVEDLVREEAVLTVEREALHNAPGQVLQRLRRETLQGRGGKVFVNASVCAKFH